MRPIDRSEILDYVSYSDQREAVREGALAAKELRRYRVGRYLCLLLENRETVRYQIQEMMRVERIVREAEIGHEIRTYNELLGADGKLGATLLIGIPDEAQRDVRLRRWLGLNDHLYLRLEDGSLARPSYDPRQVGEDRLSAVQYLIFDVRGLTPVAVGCDFDDPELRGEYELSAAERAALRADLDEA